MSDRIPNLELYFANGYSYKTSDFLRRDPIFEVDYDRGMELLWGVGENQREVTIPEGMTATVATFLSHSQSTTLLETANDFDEMFSAATSIEYTGVSYNGSASSTLMFASGLFVNTKTSSALDFAVQSLLTFKRSPISKSSLTAGFLVAFQNLPTTPISETPEVLADYISFLDLYGTHYVDTGRMGGMRVMSTFVNESLFSTYSKAEVTGSISAGFNGVVSKRSMSAEAAYSSSSFLQENSESIDVNVTVMGGIYSDSFTEWSTSIYSTPILLIVDPFGNIESPMSSLFSITQLVDTALADESEAVRNIVKANINYALDTFIAEDAQADGIISSRRNLHFEQAYPAADAASLYMVNLMEDGNGDRSIADLYDSTSNPSDPTLLACCSQHYFTGKDTHVLFSSMTVPAISQVVSCVLQKFNDRSITTMTRSFLGVSAKPAFGESEDVNIAGTGTTTYHAPNDGLLCVYVRATTNGGRGYVTAKIGSDTIAASSCHFFLGSDTHVPSNTFTVPLLKDQLCDIDYQSTSPTTDASGFFIPLTTDYSISSRIGMSTNIVYQAASDGFLVAFIQETANGDRGYVKLLQHKDDEFVNNEALATQVTASIHYFTGSDTWVPYNSATMPVIKGHYYKALWETTSGNPRCTVNFYPFAPNSLLSA